MVTRRMRPTGAALALLILFLAQIPTGCSDESSTGIANPGNETPEYPLPLVSDEDAGRDQAITNLELAYAQLRYEQYARLVHPGYVFRLDPRESELVGIRELSAAEDLDSTFGMFSGETGIEPELDWNGLPTGRFKQVPGVKSIQANLMPASSSQWTLMTGGEFAGTWRRVYALEMEVSYQGGTRIDEVSGRHIVYVAAGTITVDGTNHEVWQIRAWEDQSIQRAVFRDSGLAPPPGSGADPRPIITVSLGSLKAQFSSQRF